MSDPITAKGKAPKLSDADIEALAEVTLEDVEEANEFWKEHAADEFRDVLDAETSEDDEE